MRLTKSVLLSLLSVFALTGFSTPDWEEVIFDSEGRKLPDAEVNSSKVNWKLLKFAESEAYNGIVLLDINGMGGGCSATLIDTDGAPNAPAYALTNGHCVGGSNGGDFLEPGEFLVDGKPPRGMSIKLNYFIDAGPAVRSIPVRRISYATMTHTDVAVLELAIPFRDLVKEGYHPRKIATVDPSAGTEVEMVGIPQSGVKAKERFIRRSTCQIGARANLREGDYVFKGAFRHGCSSVGGSSGTSMVARESGKIVAINNTGISDRALRDSECALNRPCEVRSDGSVQSVYETNYAQRVTDVPSCFDAQGIFNINLAGCKLER